MPKVEKLSGAEGKSWNVVVAFKNYFLLFFSLSLAFAFSISRMGMAADQSNRCGKDMSIFFKKITAKKTKVYTF